MSSAAALDVSDSQYDSQGTLTLGQTPPQARPKPSTSGALAESGGSNSSSWEILESQESDPQSEVINVGSEVLPDAAAVAASEAGVKALSHLVHFLKSFTPACKFRGKFFRK